MTYRLTLPMTMKVHDDFQVSFLKRNIKDVDHIIDCYVLDVDPNGEFQLKPQFILETNILMHLNQEIEQAKVKWKHFRPNEATWVWLIRRGLYILPYFLVKETQFWYMYI